MNKNFKSVILDTLFRLDGRNALITGAAGNLGRAISRILCEAGAHVILNGRTRKTIDEFACELKDDGYDVSTAVLDITDDKQLVELFKRIRLERGCLDIIVNNASAGRCGTIENATKDDFYKSYEINVVAAFRTIQLGKPLLKEGAKKNPGGASVINIATMYGVISPDPAIYGKSGLNNPPHYGAAKAGLIQLTRYAACHLANDKIRVNAISPGPFPNSTITKEQPSFLKELCRKNPMNRIGQSYEVCGPVLFLASDASSYVTGINLIVDGGWTAW